MIGWSINQLPCFNFLKKQLCRPVWQAMPPTCSTINKITSSSQSNRISCTRWIWPDSSPLRHNLLRLRDQYTTCLLSLVSINASRFIHANISTLPVPNSCAMTGTKSFASHFISSNQFKLPLSPTLSRLRARELQSHFYSIFLHIFLSLLHRIFTVMKNAGCQNRVCAAQFYAIYQMLQIAHAARGD